MAKWILYISIIAFAATWAVGYFVYHAGSNMHLLLVIAILLGVFKYGYSVKTVPSRAGA